MRAQRQAEHQHRPPRPERDVIRHAQQGDARAFTVLYEAHKRHVYGLCFRMTRSRELAEELTQETFLQVFRKLTSYRGDAAFSTWLHRVAVNIVLMALRHERPHVNDVPLEEEHTNEEQLPRSPLERLAQEDERLGAAAERIALESAISDLPAGYGLVFLLHDVYGYHHSDIAELMGCSVGNPKSQLHKARLRLRQRLLGKAVPLRRPRKPAKVAA